MKRSEIKRKTPMPPRKTWMPRQSKKRRKLMSKVKPFRDKYLAAHLVCEVCLKRTPVEVHEICRGPHREKSLDKEFAVLAVCRPCHDELDCHKTWPVSRQLALRVLRSPALFGMNFEIVNELRGYSATEFENADIFKHLDLKGKP